jgi:hypothetical protein
LSAISTGSVSVVSVGFQTTTTQSMPASDLQKQWWHLEEVCADHIFTPRVFNTSRQPVELLRVTQGSLAGFFKTVKKPQKLNLEWSFETRSLLQNTQCIKNKVI